MKFGFLGSGKMAAALAQGAAKSGAIAPDDLLFTDHVAKAAQDLAASTGGQAVASNQALAQAADVIVVCVKPGDVASARGNDEGRHLSVTAFEEEVRVVDRRFRRCYRRSPRRSISER